MTQLSSGFTIIYKRIFPALWLGFAGLLVFFDIRNYLESGTVSVGALILFLIGIIFFATMTMNLADKVYIDAENTFHVTQNGKTISLPFSNIHKIQYSTSSPPRVTITTIQQTLLGSRISFSPPFHKNPIHIDPRVESIVEQFNSFKANGGDDR